MLNTWFGLLFRFDKVRQHVASWRSLNDSSGWGCSATPCVTVSVQLVLPFLLLPHDHNGLLTIIPKLQLRSACETCSIVRRTAED